MKKEIVEIPLANLVPDELQPRKLFDAIKLKSLAGSIKKLGGIKNPLTVQEIGKNKFMIIHGERRFRAATMLKLKTVPSIIEPVQNSTDRLISQYNIQEQSEAWTPAEKAFAITVLSEELGISMRAVCTLLSVASTDAARYVAFANIADKEGWLKSEVPLDYAIPINSLKTRVRGLMQNQLEKDYTKSDDKRIEHRIIELVKTGAVVKRGDLTKLADAFTKNPKLIEKFMHDSKTTPVSLFTESKAAGAYHLRNAFNSAEYFRSHGDKFLETRDIKLTNEHVLLLKALMKTANQLLDLAE